MTSDSNTESLEADFRDISNARAANPLLRLLLAVGAFLTLIMGCALSGLAVFDVLFDFDIVLGCAVVSVATIPIIYIFWMNEVGWSGSPISVFLTVSGVAVLTWLAELLLSVLVLIALAAIFR